MIRMTWFCFLYGFENNTESGDSPTRRMLTQIFFMKKLDLDRKNRTVL